MCVRWTSQCVQLSQPAKRPWQGAGEVVVEGVAERATESGKGGRQGEN